MGPRRTKRIFAIITLLVLLALLLAAYFQYRSTRSLGIDFEFQNAEVFPAPQYLYSFSGADPERLVRPLGVLVDGNRVLVTAGRRSTIDVFTPLGRRIATWGKGKLGVPLYVAKHPKTGDYYVSDRRLKAVLIFNSQGTFKGQFDPKLPKNELPSFEATPTDWAPVALDFGSDGTFYVTEILNGHRLVIFEADGSFRKAVGTGGIVQDAKAAPGAFQFPNSVKVRGDEVWVADSNNRRIQVFNRDGDFKRIIPTQGLPRGFDFLPKENEKDQERFVVVDTLAHDGTIWESRSGEKVVTFGERGVLEAQFSYPNDMSVDSRRRIFVADTANGRIQVWGWPASAGVIPTPDTPLAWALCLSPLALLPFLLLLRRRRYFATADFVLALFDAEKIPRMVQRRVRWEVLEKDYETLRGLTQDGVSLGDLLHPVEFSESDAAALQDRYQLDWDDAVVLSAAQRSKLFGTENAELGRTARVLEIKAVDHHQFTEMFPQSEPADSRAK